MPEVLVVEIKPGFAVRGSYVLKSKKLLPYRESAGYFLAVKLGDKTGEIEGRVWEKGEEINAELKVGEIVAVEGRAVEYNGSRQLRIDSIVKHSGEIDASRFIPVAAGLEEARAELGGLIDSLSNGYLKELLLLLFSDKNFIDAFCLAPAAKIHHHAQLGGLLLHSINVAVAADKLAPIYRQADRNLLVAGALLHDLGKVREYQYQGAIEATDEGRLLGHIISGTMLLDRYILRISGFPESLRLKLLHILVSHHGRYEWQSPKRPKFLEAAILHQLDLLDALADMFSRAVSGREDKDSAWAGWVKGLDRYVYCD
jgi:3'-5' exoribonuclease